MRKSGFLLLLSIISMLAGCGAQGNSSIAVEDYEADPAAETTAGDFIYRLVAESGNFEAGGPIKMYAELEYTGPQERIDIYHAASPFYFHLRERTRDFEVLYPMNEPLISTTLIKGEPLRESYQGSGGYSEEDPEEYQAFIKKVIDGQFPEGFYEVDGSANFYTGHPDGEKIDYDIHANISFKVME